MSVNNFIIKTNIGLYCPAGGFYLDTLKGVDKALVSNSHGDHAVPN